MAMGCLAALFGIGWNSSPSQPSPPSDEYGMGEGEIHSGPGGYEGMGYAGGYAADYRVGHAEHASEAEESWADLGEGEEA